jgi:hypothetical protein
MNSAWKTVGIIVGSVVLLMVGVTAGAMASGRTWAAIREPQIITGMGPQAMGPDIRPFQGMPGPGWRGYDDGDNWRGQRGGMMGPGWRNDGSGSNNDGKSDNNNGDQNGPKDDQGNQGGKQQYEYGMSIGPNGAFAMHGGFVPDESLVPADGETLDIDGAIKVAEAYLADYGDDNLQVAEVMQFDNHFYAEVKEKDSGTGAFEILIDPQTAAVFPEPGPSMMWNTKYGRMGGRGYGMMQGYGMMGGVQPLNGETPEMTITAEEALTNAQEAIDKQMAGNKAGSEAEAFYGYYTIHIEKDGKVVGMLSVNGYTGDVWFHSWHGTFVEMEEVK